MTRKKSKNITSCPEWSSQVQGLIDLPESDDVKSIWVKHTETCSECRSVLRLERHLGLLILQMKDPGPARTSAKVLRKIRSKRIDELSFQWKPLGLGFAGSIAGIFLGFWMFGAIDSMAMPENNAANFEQIISDFANGVDPLVSIIDIEE